MEQYKLIQLLYSRDTIDEVKFFIDSHPDKINEIEGFFLGGEGTLLHFACLWSREQVIQFLLSKNADCTIKFIHKGEFNNLTPKEISQKKNDISIVELFDKKKTVAPTPIQNKTGTSFSNIIENQESEMVVLLKKFNVDYVERFEKYGVTNLEEITHLEQEDWKMLNIPPFHQRKIKEGAQSSISTHTLQSNVTTTTTTTTTAGNRLERRSSPPTFSSMPGEHFLKYVPNSPTDEQSVLSCLEHWPTIKKEDLDIPLIEELLHRLSQNKSKKQPITLCWLWVYTKESWPYKRINELLRQDSPSIAHLASFMNALIRSFDGLSDNFFYSGVVYRASRLPVSSVQKYKPKTRFIWPGFTSTTTCYDPTGQFGDILFEITIPKEFKTLAVNVQLASAFPEEEEILLLPNVGYIVQEVINQPTQFPKSSCLIKIVAAWRCVV